MNTKEKLLELFVNNKDKYFSGEEIAARIGISRTAVWKAVNCLRADGYSIEAFPNKGYCLSGSDDIISVQGIKKYLSADCSDCNIEVFPTIGSTNSALRKKADEGAPEGACIISGSQTSGRGRDGRVFYSPEGSGVYLSVLLRPSAVTAQQAVRITTMAAVATCEAIGKITDEIPYIKWVNDIYMNGKKVCGILTEAAFSLESGMVDYAVLGVGINLYPPENGFPKDIQKIAGAVLKDRQNEGKNRTAAEFLNSFMKIYRQPEKSDYVRRYRERSFLIGKNVGVINAGGVRRATVLDVDDNCHLIVKYDNGETGRLFSGEVSLDITEINRME